MPLINQTFSQIITFTRASGATYFDATGTLQTAATDVPRFDYNPSTLAAQGFLIEEARTNSIRNNTMQGAVAGTPGTLPTNWVVVAGGLGTLTQQVVGTGTSAGITYIDIRLNGTTSTTSVGYSFEATTQIVAAQNQAWTSTFWAALQAGSLTNINTVENRVIERDAAGTSLGSTITDFKASFTSTLVRTTTTRTLASASAARVTNDIVLSFPSGVAIDITIRIGLPQLERGAFATSVIPTVNAFALGVTREADVASVNTLSPWFNATASTLYTEFSSPVPTTVSASAAVAGYDDGTANNRFSNFYTSNTGAVAANQNTGGTGNFTINAASGLTLSNVQKQATRFQAGSYASSANGAAVVTDPFASAPPTVNTLRFGLRPSGTQANMWLRRVTVYPRGLSNAELQAITA